MLFCVGKKSVAVELSTVHSATNSRENVEDEAISAALGTGSIRRWALPMPPGITGYFALSTLKVRRLRMLVSDARDIVVLMAALDLRLTGYLGTRVVRQRSPKLTGR